MPFQLTKTYPRLWSLEAGVAMVVTDLHGDWDLYVRYRDHFLGLRAQGRADCCTVGWSSVKPKAELTTATRRRAADWAATVDPSSGCQSRARSGESRRGQTCSARSLGRPLRL